MKAAFAIGALLVALAASAAGDFERATIFQAPAGQSAMYAQYTPLSNGALLCTFRLAVKDGNNPWTVPGSKIVCLRSTDGGRTWSKKPVLIYQDKDSSAYTSQCGLGYQARDGTLLVPFYVVTMTGEGRPEHIHWNLLATSRDGGESWACRNLASEPFLSNPTYGGLQRSRSGKLWRVERCRGYGLDLADAYLRKKSWLDVRACVRIVESGDEGRSWSPLCSVGYDSARAAQTARFPVEFKEDEPALVQLPSGKILLLARPYLYQAVSTNAGKDWQIGPSNLTRPPQKTRDLSGLSPVLWHSPAGPAGGTTLLAYHDRWGAHAAQGGVYISASHDECQTWGRPVFMAPGAYPCLYEPTPGKIICGHYRSNALLEATFFSVPFPTGLWAEVAAVGAQPSVTVAWDPYQGPEAGSYGYRLYRGERAESVTELIGTVQGQSSLVDRTVKSGQRYFYRVVAFQGEREAGRSWLAEAQVREPK